MSSDMQYLCTSENSIPPSQSEAELKEEKSSIHTEPEEVSAKELADAKEKIEFLKTELTKSNTKVDHLKDLMGTIMLQNKGFSIEICHFMNKNMELQDKCLTLRSYYTMERNALRCHLSGVYKLLEERTKQLEKTWQINRQRDKKLLDVNLKIQLMENNILKIKMLILKCKE